MLAIPLICILVEVVALSPNALVEGTGAIVVLSAVESGFGEQVDNATRLMRTADNFAAEGIVVIRRLVGERWSGVHILGGIKHTQRRYLAACGASAANSQVGGEHRDHDAENDHHDKSASRPERTCGFGKPPRFRYLR